MTREVAQKKIERECGYLTDRYKYTDKLIGGPWHIFGVKGRKGTILVNDRTGTINNHIELNLPQAPDPPPNLKFFRNR